MSGFVVDARTWVVFEKMEFVVDGRRILVLWERLNEPDVVIRYCGVNYVYFDAVTTWWDEILVEWNVSRYVGPPSWYKPGDLEGGARLNSERLRVASELKNAFEKTGVRELGWVGMLDLVYYFEWEPKILGVSVYLGGVEAPKEAKINRIKALLNRVSGVLEEYNVSIVMIQETYTAIHPEKLFPAGYALSRALNEARMNKSGIPDVVRRYVVEGGWNAGNSLSLVVGLSFYQPPPDRKDLELLVKWIRDRMGHCETPLVIVFNVPKPEGREILPGVASGISVEPRLPGTGTSITETITATVGTMMDVKSSRHTDSLSILILIVLLVIAIGLLIARRIL
jgi:hypothetical protein